MIKCTGHNCPMLYDKVNPASCSCADTCPNATPPILYYFKKYCPTIYKQMRTHFFPGAMSYMTSFQLFSIMMSTYTYDGIEGLKNLEHVFTNVEEWDEIEYDNHAKEVENYMKEIKDND